MKTIVTAIENLTKTVDRIAVDVADLKTDVGGMKDDVDVIAHHLIDLEMKVDSSKIEIMDHIEGFIGLHRKTDEEVTALRAQGERIEERVTLLEAKA